MAVTIANYSINGANPSTVGGTGTAAKYFPNLPGPSIGASNLTPSATNAAGQLLVPGSNRLNGQKFNVLASGNFVVGTGGGSSTVTLTLSANTGTVASPTYTTIAASTAYASEALDGVYYPFLIDVTVQGDTLSGIIQGTQTIYIDNSINRAATALNSTLSGLNFATEPPFGLVLSVTFGTSVAGNSANLYRFSIEA